MDFNALTPTRWGTMLYHRHDHYIGQSLERYGEFSPDEAAMLVSLAEPGHYVIDGGANQGAFTIPLAQKVGMEGSVYAFEPQRLTYQVLCANAAINSLANVFALQAALGAVQSVATIPLLDPRLPYHSGGVRAAEAGQGERVPVLTIDGLNLPRLDLLKLDIEGHERAALRGAVRTIADHRPVLYVENDKPEHFLLLISDIRALGYRLYWHFTYLYRANNWKQEADNLFPGTMSSNMLCLPPGDTRDFGLPPVTDELPRHLRDMCVE